SALDAPWRTPELSRGALNPHVALRHRASAFAGFGVGPFARVQLAQDGPLLLARKARPAGDLVERTEAAEAEIRFRVQGADADAGGGGVGCRHRVRPNASASSSSERRQGARS